MKLLMSIMLFVGRSFSIENDWALKGGLGLNYQSIQGFHLSRDDMFGLSATTSFGYRFSRLAINAASFISLGKVEDIKFKINHEEYSYGNSNFGSFNIIFLIKYYSRLELIKNYEFYISLGPGISLQTFWPEEQSKSLGFLPGTEKISLESSGVYGTIGFEEVADFKEELPKFMEIMWGFNKAFKAHLIEVENARNIEVIKSENYKSYFKNFILLINFGITFF